MRWKVAVREPCWCHQERSGGRWAGPRRRKEPVCLRFEAHRKWSTCCSKSFTRWRLQVSGAPCERRRTCVACSLTGQQGFNKGKNLIHHWWCTDCNYFLKVAFCHNSCEGFLQYTVGMINRNMFKEAELSTQTIIVAGLVQKHVYDTITLWLFHKHHCGNCRIQIAIKSIRLLALFWYNRPP